MLWLSSDAFREEIRRLSIPDCPLRAGIVGNDYPQALGVRQQSPLQKRLHYLDDHVYFASQSSSP